MTGHDVEYCGFGTMNANTSAVIGEAYWAGIPEGTQVDIAKAQRAIQKRFKEAHIAVVPWTVPGVDEMTKSFLMNDETKYLEGREFGDYKKGFTDKLNEMTTEYLEAVLQKADSTTTLASSLMHVIADDQVTYLYKRPYPFQALIPVEANKGKTASWDSVGPYEITQAAFGREDPDLQEVEMTAHNRTDTIKYMYTVGRLTKAVKFAGLSQVPVRDIKAIRIDLAQDAMRALRERAMLGVTRNLQSTTNAFEAAGTLEYSGIYQLITAASSYANKCYTTSTGTLYADIMVDLDTSYNQMVLMGMQPNIAICDYKTFGIIRRGVVQFLRYIGEPVKTIVPGVSKIDLVFPGQDGLSLIPHPFMPQTTGANGNIMLLDTRLLARRVLWQDTYEELANLNTSEKFVISASETFIDKSDVDGTSSLHGGVFGITI
jgi:hypothetical protein